MKAGKKYLAPVIFFVIFETVAVILWLTKDNLFYLFNFSYLAGTVLEAFYFFLFHFPAGNVCLQVNHVHYLF